MIGEVLLETQGLARRFGAVRALEDVSFRVRRGEVQGLLGLNGAGKTTLLRLVLGLLRPDAGSVRLFGREGAEGLRAARARMGALVEAPAFHPGLSGRRNLELHAALSGPLPRGRIADMLERVGLAAAADRRAGRYSLGMKQRLGIALALVSEPEFVILDEPTNGLDPNGILEMRRLVRELAAAGTTFLISSHLLHEIEELCTRVAVLDGGRLRLQDDLEALRERAGGRWALEAAPLDDARSLLERRDDVSDLEPHGDGRRLLFRAPRAALPEIHRSLVEASIEVTVLEELRAGLEEIFLELAASRTAGVLT